MRVSFEGRHANQRVSCRDGGGAEGVDECPGVALELGGLHIEGGECATTGRGGEAAIKKVAEDGVGVGLFFVVFRVAVRTVAGQAMNGKGGMRVLRICMIVLV